MCLSLTIQEEGGSFDFSHIGQVLKACEGRQKRIHMTGQLGVATGIFWGHFQWKSALDLDLEDLAQVLALSLAATLYLSSLGCKMKLVMSLPPRSYL